MTDPAFPLLPSGYEAQPAWGYRDPATRFHYGFHRVYGPSKRAIGPLYLMTGELDKDRSYWIVTWQAARDASEGQPASRWLSYAQARAIPGFRLSFEEFSSPLGMRERLPKLLEVPTAPVLVLEPVPPRVSAGASLAPL